MNTNAVEESQPEVSAAFKLNDATVLGDLPEDFLERQITIALSPHGKQTGAGNWKNMTLKLSALLNTLTHHRAGEKDGHCILQGEVIDGERRATAIRQCSLVMLDLDTGEDFAAIRERIQAKGWFCLAWTTHSHMKPISDPSKADVLKHMGRDEEPTTADVVAYLRDVKRYQPHILEGAELVRQDHTSAGVKLIVRHQPMPKFRLLFVLTEPFVFATRATNPRKAVLEWKARYAGLSEVLGATFDRSCVDPSRLMFTPRHPPKAEGFFIEVIPGESLNINDVPLVDAKRIADGDAFDRVASVVLGGSKRGEIKTQWLKRWLAINAESFDAEGFWRDYGEERKPRSSGAGCHFRCPNDGAHSNPGDPDDNAFWVVSGPDNDNGKGFQARCEHDSCRPFDRGQMLELFIQEHGLTEEDLAPYVAEVIEGDGSRKAFQPPYPYGRNGDKFGLWKGKDEDRYFVEVCAAFEVLGVTHDETGADWGKIIRFRNPTGQQVEIVVSDGRIHDDASALRSEIAKAGLWIGPKVKSEFEDLLSRLASDKVIVTATRPGWHSDQEGRRFYVTPNGDVIGGGNDGTAWRLKDGAGIKVQGRKGTLEGWQKAAEGLIASNDHWAIGVSAGWAGVLIELCGYETCGFMFSGRSGRGKTTTLETAGSSWGYVGPKLNDGLVVSARSTANAVEGLAARANGTVLAIDELKMLEPKEIGGLIMQLASGSGKSRMNKDVKMRASASWSCFMLLSGERTVRQYVEGAGEAYLAGYTSRLPDLSVSEGKTLTPNAIKAIRDDGIRQHYGHAGPAFVEALFRLGYADDPSELTDRIHAAAVSIAGEENNGVEVMQRAARPFALCAVAASIAGEGGILSEASVDRVHEALLASFARFSLSDEAKAADPMAEAQGALVDYLASNCRGGPVLRVDDERARAYKETVAWFDDDMVYVRANKLAEIAGGKVVQAAFARYLSKAGVLVAGRKEGELAHDYLAGVGSVRHYCLSAAALGFAPPPLPSAKDEK